MLHDRIVLHYKARERAAHELKEIGVSNQFLLVNGILKDYMQNDNVSNALFKRQSRALENMAEELKIFLLMKFH